jgi:hypothetical protein
VRGTVQRCPFLFLFFKIKRNRQVSWRQGLTQHNCTLPPSHRDFISVSYAQTEKAAGRLV